MKAVLSSESQRMAQRVLPAAKVEEFEPLLLQADKSEFLAYVDSHDFLAPLGSEQVKERQAAGMLMLSTGRTEIRYLLRPDGSGLIAVFRDGVQITEVSWQPEMKESKNG